MRTFITISIASLLASCVAAQGAGFNATIDPSTISPTLKSQWCLAETNSCPELCGGIDFTDVKNCTNTDLSYSCLCVNGSSPDLAAYTETMPYYLCEQTFSNCIQFFENNQAGQAQCTTNYTCGSLDPSKNPASTSSASTSASTSSAAATSTVASATTTSATTTPSATKNAAIQIGQDYGIGFFAAGAMAAFGFLL